MAALNLGILAHVDAGKTSLTERLLHTVGVIDEMGRVDDGTTRTDSLRLEQQRGITIRAAVVSFVLQGDPDVVVNLVDTPGHPDFIAEVERSLAILDGVVLVLSAVEGVQSQTRVLMRALQRLRIPTLLFVNKIDRGGADPAAVVDDVVRRLTPAVLVTGEVVAAGSRRASVHQHDTADPAFLAGLAELLAEHDDHVLADVADGARPTYDRLRPVLVRQVQQALVQPVYFGSAVTGAGARELLAGIRELLPVTDSCSAAPLAAGVFKVERGPAGEKVAYVRVSSGTLRVRDRVRVSGVPGRQKVTAVEVFDRGATVPSDAVPAGRVAKVRGLQSVQVGDVVGTSDSRLEHQAQFAPPTLETVVETDPASRGALHAALVQLAEQDPLIGLRQDDERGEMSLSLYGEVQKEVIEATLAQEYGVRATFRESTTMCVERVLGTGEAVEVIAVEPNPFLATVGLRVEPRPQPESANRFRLGVEPGSMPPAFFSAVEETVLGTLEQGLLGWRVTGALVTMTRAGYWPRQSHAHATFDKSMSSTAGDFRLLTPLVLMTALARAGTEVRQPVHLFELDVPADALGAVLGVLARLGAVPWTTERHGAGYALTGTIPGAAVHDLQQRLPALTHGAGELVTAFDHYAPVRGAAPARPRTDDDPLHRSAYLLRVQRRVGRTGG